MPAPRPQSCARPGSLQSNATGSLLVSGEGLIKGKKWLLQSRWKNLTCEGLGELNRLFQLNRRVFKAYLLKESLERLWTYQYRGAMLNYLQRWMDQLKWQRLRPFEKLAEMLLKHLDGIANYCETKVRFGVVESLNGNIRVNLSQVNNHPPEFKLNHLAHG